MVFATRDSPAAPSRRRQAGFGLLEMLIGLSVLAMALLGYVSTTLSHQRLAEESAARAEVLQVGRQFIERLRGDPDWPTLYERLRGLQIQASAAGVTGRRMDDGRHGFPVTAYCPDMVVPASLDSLVVLVDVPFAPDETGTNALREDVTDPAYALPADLNGDGVIDDQARDDDLMALPIVVHFHWIPRGEASRQMSISTALRGEG